MTEATAEKTAGTHETNRTARTLRPGKEGSTVGDKNGTEPKADAAAAGAGGRKKLLVIAALAVVALAAAGYFLVLAPKGDAKAAPPKPTPGAVVKLDPITVNLAGGHFLKLGLSLQATADAGEDVSGAQALDAAIDMLSGKSIQDLASRDGRDRAKAGLLKKVSQLYEGKVYDIYFTDFVMQ